MRDLTVTNCYRSVDKRRSQEKKMRNSRDMLWTVNWESKTSQRACEREREMEREHGLLESIQHWESKSFFELQTLF